MSDRTAFFGETLEAARYRFGDTSTDGGDYVVAEDLDGERVLLQFDYDADEWQYAGDVDMGGGDLNSVGTARVDALEAERIETVADYVISTENDSKDIIENQLSEGDTVVFENGTHELDGVTVGADDVTLIGTKGATLQLPATELESTGNFSVIRIPTERTGVLFRGFTVDFNRDAHTGTEDTNQFGVDCRGHGCTIENLKVINVSGNGIQLENAENCSILNNQVEDGGGWGIHTSTGTESNRIAHNSVSNFGQTFGRGGLDQAAGSNGNNIYVANKIRNCNIGLRFDSENATVIGNGIENSDNAGLAVQGGSGHSVTGGQITQSGQTGLQISPNANDVTISDTTVRDSGDRDVRIQGTNATVEGLTITNTGGTAVLIPEDAILSVTVSNCTITGGHDNGILLNDGQGCTIVGNTIEGTDTDPIRESGNSDNNTIVANVADGSVSISGASSQTNSNINTSS